MEQGIIRTTKADGSEQVDYLYRVSLRALIRNEEGKVLAVKEHGDMWHLPGGGLDHSETIDEGLARELREETGYTGKFTSRSEGVYLSRVERLGNLMQVILVFEVVPESFDFPGGPDSAELEFVDESEVFDLQQIDER